jgi:hypothetical protein
MKTRKAKRTRAAPPTIARDARSALYNLEAPIRDLERASNIAYLMTMREQEDGNAAEGLALFAMVQVEQLAAALRKQFYSACEGKAVKS